MKVCFYHEPFDTDVSSGTIHALYQWFELFQAFNVKECAIINKLETPPETINSDMVVYVFKTLKQFEAKFKNQNKVYVEKGGRDYRKYRLKHKKIDWLIFGGTESLPEADISIPTYKNVSLYPREAAAIILSNF